MKKLDFPIRFLFKITTLSNDFTATDANNNIIAYVRQKMFKLKEDILLYEDETKAKVKYRIRADKWLDFSTSYTFYDENGEEIGRVARKGWASLWKANYTLVDEDDRPQYKIREENPWVKVIDSIFGEIPILGMFTGYMFNPSYIVTKVTDEERTSKNDAIARLKKLPSMFGRKFEIDKLATIDYDDQERIMLGLMMMILLERRRG